MRPRGRACTHKSRGDDGLHDPRHAPCRRDARRPHAGRIFARGVREMPPRRRLWSSDPSEGPVERLTYEQVLEGALTVARALVARGVTKETRVGLLATNRPEWVTAIFGIALAGGTCVTLPTFAKGCRARVSTARRRCFAAHLRARGGRSGFRERIDRVVPRAHECPRRGAIDAAAVLAAGGVHREVGPDRCVRALVGLLEGRPVGARPAGGSHRRRGRARRPRPRVLLLGLDGKAQGHRACAPRRRDPVLALAPHFRRRSGRADVDRERPVLGRQFRDGAGHHLRGGRMPRPPTLLRARRELEAHARRSRQLAARLAASMGGAGG